jgi:hypothetical protein
MSSKRCCDYEDGSDPDVEMADLVRWDFVYPLNELE